MESKEVFRCFLFYYFFICFVLFYSSVCFLACYFFVLVGFFKNFLLKKINKYKIKNVLLGSCCRGEKMIWGTKQ